MGEVSFAYAARAQEEQVLLSIQDKEPVPESGARESEG